MTQRGTILAIALIAVGFTLQGCGGFGSRGSGSAGSGFGGGRTYSPPPQSPGQVEYADSLTPQTAVTRPGQRRSTLLSLFSNADDPNTTLEVNKYLWNASLDILNFLPIESADPFSGIIVTGYGTPPGGGRPYRATIYVQDPAMDARALKVALATRAGPVSPDTVRAVEDAILTRARQLRIRDNKL